MSNPIYTTVLRITLAIGVTLAALSMFKKPAAAPAPDSVPVAPAPAPVVPPAPPAPLVDPELDGVQVPIPKNIRLYNKSGSQCVWCTIEMLGSFHGSKNTNGLTQSYKHATGPREVSRVLTNRNVKFKQVTGKNYAFLQEWVAEKKMGVGIGVNGNHMILVCHYEQNKLVKVIDNADRQLRIQTWDWAKFQRHFSGWAIVILPDSTGHTSDPVLFEDDGTILGGINSISCNADDSTYLTPANALTILFLLGMAGWVAGEALSAPGR